MMLSAQPDTGFTLIETGFGLLGLELAPDGPRRMIARASRSKRVSRRVRRLLPGNAAIPLRGATL